MKYYKTFKTLEEAEDYLYDNFKGHGIVYNADTGKIVSQCRCTHTDPRQIIAIEESVNESRSINEIIHTKSSQWKWANITRNDKGELVKIVYGIWKHAKNRQSFSDFLKGKK